MTFLIFFTFLTFLIFIAFWFFFLYINKFIHLLLIHSYRRIISLIPCYLIYLILSRILPQLHNRQSVKLLPITSNKFIFYLWLPLLILLDQRSNFGLQISTRINLAKTLHPSLIKSLFSLLLIELSVRQKSTDLRGQSPNLFRVNRVGIISIILEAFNVIKANVFDLDPYLWSWVEEKKFY